MTGKITRIENLLDGSGVRREAVDEYHDCRIIHWGRFNDFLASSAIIPKQWIERGCLVAEHSPGILISASPAAGYKFVIDDSGIARLVPEGED